MKYSVSKTGYTLSTDDVDHLLELDNMGKEQIRTVLDAGQFFFESKAEADEEASFSTEDECSVLKKKLTVTIEVEDVKPKQNKRNTSRKPNSKPAQ